MKKIFSLLLIGIFAVNLFAQENEAIKLIIRVDDMGSAHSGNLACMETLTNGIAQSVEVMAVAPWFPEAVKLLNKNPQLDVGLHLVITSEWENIKWRPLTECPSLTDANGYFLPMMGKNENYPGLAITENDWKLDEIEKEMRAQIEFTLKNIPQLTHITGHMGSTGFDEKVKEMTHKLAEEYNLSDGIDLTEKFGVENSGYWASKLTSAEKEEKFIELLNSLQKGKTYLFLDHPGYNNLEMQGMYHIGYENVAYDRQGVTELFTSPKVEYLINEKGIQLVSYNDIAKSLPRSTPENENFDGTVVKKYLEAVKENNHDLHSLMILRHGKVIAEKWLGEHSAKENHIMNSVSKTFTATAVGFAVQEGKLNVSDKVINYFKDDLPEKISDNLKKLEIRHLLTMSVGHADDPTYTVRETNGSWEKMFLAKELKYEPGTKFVYNSLASYMLSCIVQKVTGEKVIDYLYPRLFRPLGISGVTWDTSPTGYNTGGWGLYVKTEDMAKLGQFILQKGKWNGKQLLSEEWINEAAASHIKQPPQWMDQDKEYTESDWVQGYCYQMWRCRFNAFRADGRNGQFIILLPEQDAVIVTTANIPDMQAEINLIWEYLLPAFK